MIFFFYGPNSYASRRKLQDLIEAYKKKTGGDFGLERLDGTQVSWPQLQAAVTAVPLFASSRLVIVEGLGANKGVTEKISALIDQVPDSTVMVIYETEVDQRTTFFKTLNKQAKAVRFAPLNPAQLAAWIKQTVQKLGGSIDQSAINLLVEAVGDDQWRVEQELQKLVNYRSDIGVDSVNEMVTITPQQTIFDLVEAITAGKTKQALTMFQNLRDDKTNELYILSMIIWQLRNLLLAKTADNLSPTELAKQTGMSPYVAGKAMSRQSYFEEGKLKHAFLEAVETDYAIKTGQGKPDQLVERLIYQLAAN